MFNEYNDLLSVEELCDILCIGKNTAYAILNSGELKAFRTGRTWKIPKMALAEYVFNKTGIKRQ